ncbi:MAG: hypothetical protein NTZ83_04030 [Candidatus Pacearchaeota archaeon]|nr:hypothetical protein [Candidatus Pacearchaeota archaeon]
MSFEDILKRNPNLTLKDLQDLQKDYDNRFIVQKGFFGFDKVRHTYAHIGKLVGRLADYIHDMEEHVENISEEDIKNKVIPDLLVYSAWLAQEFGVDMEQAYLTRFVGNLKRLYTERISTEELQSLENCVKEKLNLKKD